MFAPDHAPAPARVRVMTVCTGNVCRSPYAELLLREGLGWARPGGFEVSSAGTHALVGRPVDPGSQRQLEAKGIDAGGFRARLLTPALIAEQDLVLVMSGRQREHVLEEWPAAHRRTFSVIELARVLEDIGGAHDWSQLMAGVGATDVRSRWAALPGLLAAHRRRGSRKAPDVVDPYRRGDAVFARMAAEIDPAVRSIVLWERQFPR